jgi:asparagine synthase (glutamine-hydrolysing)
MCGIVGFTGQRNESLLHGMLDALKHRGPDGEGLYHCPENQVNLGHRRLSIVDISGGRQPMWSKDNSVGIIFNGEIYNHKELRIQLEKLGYQFNTDHSDTEVLIYGYKEWGLEVLKKLNGMYSFCIYDKKTKKLFLARDRFGKKPLYYTLFGKNIIFASELKSLSLHPLVSTEIDPVGLNKYFAYGFIPAPYSLYKNVKKLPAGHLMVFDLKTSENSINCYWKFEIKPDFDLLKRPEEDIASELRALLSDAVNIRMLADVPVGIFLSGGIDSSAILACASIKNINDRIKTFSIGFNEKTFDESLSAKKISEFFKADHSSKMLDVNNVKDFANEVLDKLDEPMGDSSILPTYLLSKFAKKSVTVALSGDGGDELFAGYAPFRALKIASFYSKFTPKFLRNFIFEKVKKIPVSESYLSLDFKLKRALQGLEYPAAIWNPVWLSPLVPEEISALMRVSVSVEDVYGDAIEAWDNCYSKNILDRSMEFYTKFYLQDNVLTKVDRASMMNGLEVRSPFLDNNVVDFVLKMPASLKYKRGISKYILKKSMEGLLPNEVLYRQKKGFGIPLTSWLKSWPLKEIQTYNFDNLFVKKKYEEHKLGIKDNRLFIWNWIVLTNFINEN